MFLAHFPEKGISNCIAHGPMIRVLTASGGALRNWWSVGRGPVQEAKGNLVSPQVRLLSSDRTRVHVSWYDMIAILDGQNQKKSIRYSGRSGTTGSGFGIKRFRTHRGLRVYRAARYPDCRDPR